MHRKLIAVIIFFFLIFFQSLFSQDIKKETELPEEWQTNPDACAKLFYGDTLTLQPNPKDWVILKPEIKEKLIGSYIEWQAKYGLSPAWVALDNESKKYFSGNASIYSLLGHDKSEFVGFIMIDGSGIEGDKKIGIGELTWGIPPGADLRVKIKINYVMNPIIIANGMLYMAVSGSELTINSTSETCDWPLYDTELDGSQNSYGSAKPEIRVSNTFGFHVKVGLRSDGNGIDYIVPKTGSASVFVPNGKYEIYFQFSVDPTSLYKGDSFELTSNGVALQLKFDSEGNYNVKKVK